MKIENRVESIHVPNDGRAPITDIPIDEHSPLLLDYLQWEQTATADYLKDKEKKKLIMVGSIFTVFSILVSFLIAIVTYTKGELNNEALSTLFTGLSYFILMAILLAITITNIGIIKYITTLQGESLRASRQHNCIRQGILALLYEKIEDCFPIDKNKILKQLTKEDTTYWKILGRHIKLPIDNVTTRNRYDNLSILWHSADLFSVTMIAGFNVLLVVTPPLFYKLYLISSSGGDMSIFTFIIAGVSVLIPFISGYGLYRIINDALTEIRHELKADLCPMEGT